MLCRRIYTAVTPFHGATRRTNTTGSPYWRLIIERESWELHIPAPSDFPSNGRCWESNGVEGQWVDPAAPWLHTHRRLQEALKDADLWGVDVFDAYKDSDGHLVVWKIGRDAGSVSYATLY